MLLFLMGTYSFRIQSSQSETFFYLLFVKRKHLRDFDRLAFLIHVTTFHIYVFTQVKAAPCLTGTKDILFF